MKRCFSCREPLSEARLAAAPDATSCVPCLMAGGDVVSARGHMIWDHKTVAYVPSVLSGGMRGGKMLSTAQPTTSLQPCPTCGSAMQWKQNRTSHSYFMGCTQWPRCSGTRDEKGTPTAISPANQKRMMSMLKAAVRHSEDECLTFTHQELQESDLFELHLDEVTEEKSYILTVRKKS